MNIISVTTNDNYTLYVRMEDVQSGVFDVSPYLNSEAFERLKDKREFRRVRNGRYLVEWDCGADLSADTILARWQVIPKNGSESATQ